MALWKITVKQTKNSNGIKIEKGMQVEVVSDNNPIGYNGGKATIDAFMRKYAIDIKKAGALHPAYLDVQK